MELFWKRVDRCLQIGMWALTGALLLAIYTERFTSTSALATWWGAWVIATVISGLQHVPNAAQMIMQHWRVALLVLLGLMVLAEGIWVFTALSGSGYVDRGFACVTAFFVFLCLMTGGYVSAEHTRRQQSRDRAGWHGDNRAG